jgi:hypothetical protein
MDGTMQVLIWWVFFGIMSRSFMDVLRGLNSIPREIIKVISGFTEI